MIANSPAVRAPLRTFHFSIILNYPESWRLGLLRIYLLAASASAALASAPIHAAPQSVDKKICEFNKYAGELVGHSITVSGKYEWDIHYQTFKPDDCAGDDRIFVRLNASSEDEVTQFLRKAYLGVNFGGGSVWGTVTGVVARNSEGLAFVLVTSFKIDDSKLMKMEQP